MENKSSYDRYQAIIDRLVLLMDKVNCLIDECRNYNQNTLYFDGYFDGLRYAMSIVQITEKEENSHGNP